VNDPLRAQQMVRRQVRRRRLWRRLRLASLVILTTAVIAAAAFGIDRLVVVAHRFYVEHHHSAPRATGANHRTTSTTTTTTLPGAPRCDSPELSAVVSDWRETAGIVEETVTLTNIVQTPCSLAGYPSLGVVAQDGTPLPAPHDDVPTTGSPSVATTAPVGTTTPLAPVELAPKARASFELSYANTCDHLLQPGQPATGVPNECYDGVWLEVTPPLGSSPLLVTQPLRLTYATSGFLVGPFQAGDGPPLTGQPPLTSQPPLPTGQPTLPTGQ
jgi:hypothetical protein